MLAHWKLAVPRHCLSARYGSTLVEVANKLSEHEAFDANLGPQKEVLSRIETYQEAISEPLAEVVELASQVEEAGETYKIYLLITQESLEKWPMLERVSAFVEKTNEMFAAQDYGDSLRAVASRLSEFESFPSTLAAQQEVWLSCCVPGPCVLSGGRVT